MSTSRRVSRKQQACDGAQGIVAEGRKAMEEAAGQPVLRDAVITSSAAKVEHYEMVSYGDLIRVHCYWERGRWWVR